MDSLSVGIARIPSDRADVVAGTDVAILFVNGRDFIGMASEIGRPAGAGKSPSVDRYGPLTASDVLPPSLHLLGSPSSRLFQDGWAVVLCCGCGAWECGGLLARIELSGGVVTWSDFQTPYSLCYLAEHPGGALPENLSLGGFGPFRFERTAYEAALCNPVQVAWPYAAPGEEPPYSAESTA